MCQCGEGITFYPVKEVNNIRGRIDNVPLKAIVRFGRALISLRQLALGIS